MLKSYFSFIILIVFAGLLTDCSDKKAAKEPVFGELDKKAIATDTSMQVNMDLSYEYHNTLVENDSVVYDFLAYDKPKYGDTTNVWEAKYHVIRRTGSVQDTISKGNRSFGYTIRNVWLTDLNHNGHNQILFYEAPVHPDAQSDHFKFYALQTDGRKAANPIHPEFKQDNARYTGGDTFVIYQDFLIRKFPNSQGKNYTWQSYSLHGERLSLVKEKVTE